MIIDTYPAAEAVKDGVVVILSGGMDSTISARLAVERYGASKVHAITYFYGQKQAIEVDFAKANAARLGLAKHTLVDISFLGDMVRGISANIVGGKAMPTIKDILGDPTPPTYVPNRNAILLMIATSYAEANNLGFVITGLQAQDEYSYWDTTKNFVSSINGVLSQMRQRKVQVFAPFLTSNKAEEIRELIAVDRSAELLKHTITCYNPIDDVSCGVCPSCAERIANFKKVGIPDPVKYAIEIKW